MWTVHTRNRIYTPETSTCTYTHTRSLIYTHTTSTCTYTQPYLYTHNTYMHILFVGCTEDHLIVVVDRHRIAARACVRACACARQELPMFSVCERFESSTTKRVHCVYNGERAYASSTPVALRHPYHLHANSSISAMRAPFYPFLRVNSHTRGNIWWLHV